MKAKEPDSRLSWGRGSARFVARWSEIAIYAGIVVVLALLLGPAPAGAEPAVDQSAAQARVSFAPSAGMVKGASDTDWSYVTVNTPVLPGDSLWVDKEGTMELEIARGTFLRMADGSKVTVTSLTPSVSLKADTGSFIVQRLAHSTGDVTVDTPAANILVQPNSNARIDVQSSGGAIVTARWGLAVIHSEGGQDLTVRQGQRSYVDPGYLPSTPESFDRAAVDAFDTWNQERSRTLAIGVDSVPSASGITPATLGASDLAAYGNWVYTDNAYSWHPTAEGFVPYRDGYWSYVPGAGYVWVGDEPFSYVTSHYGRWRYNGDSGWLWSYQPDWSPAWVATLQCGSDFVWCPLDIYDCPVSYWGDYWAFGGLNFCFGASSFCGVDDLLIGRCRVSPCTRDVFARAHDINIWNIGHHGWRSVVKYNDRGLQARDFWPHQAFRGRETLASVRDPARTRVAALESSVRTAPHVALRTGERTPLAGHLGAAAVRTTRISPAVISNTRTILNRELRASSGNRATSRFQPSPRTAVSSGGPSGAGPAHHEAAAVMRGPVAPSRTGTSASSTLREHAVAPGHSGAPAVRSAPTVREPIQSAPVHPRDTISAPRVVGPHVRSSYERPSYDLRLPSGRSTYTPPVERSAPRSYSQPSVPSAPRVYSAPSMPSAPRSYGSPGISMAPRTFSHPSAPSISRGFSAPSAPAFHSFSHSGGGFGGGGGWSGGGHSRSRS